MQPRVGEDRSRPEVWGALICRGRSSQEVLAKFDAAHGLEHEEMQQSSVVWLVKRFLQWSATRSREDCGGGILSDMVSIPNQLQTSVNSLQQIRDGFTTFSRADLGSRSKEPDTITSPTNRTRIARFPAAAPSTSTRADAITRRRASHVTPPTVGPDDVLEKS